MISAVEFLNCNGAYGQALVNAVHCARRRDAASYARHMARAADARKRMESAAALLEADMREAMEAELGDVVAVLEGA